MSEPIQDQLEGSPDPVLEALRRLVEQIERADFRDRLGHPLKMNLAYIEARELARGYGRARWTPEE